MKKSLSITLTVILLLSFTLNAFAATGDVTTFGFNKYRNREGYGTTPVLWPAWKDTCGVSYSQPLILKGWGNYADKTLAVVAAGKELRGYIMNEPDYKDNFKENEPIWELTLHGDKITKSHPTLIEKNGRKYIYIGTEKSGNKSYIDVFDITDFNNAYRCYYFKDLWASDIVSAPLVLHWKGHEVVVYTAGNTAEVHLATDMMDKNKANNLRISLGSGRTSSSAAPILNGQGFAVGLDQGTNSGELQLFKLNDILAEQNGKVVKKSSNPYKRVELESGLVASFAVAGDWLYFGDARSRVYGYNVVTGEGWVNEDNVGIFSNRSPALTGTSIYFPAVGQLGQKGKLLAIDRETHQTKWTVNFDDRAQTAPVVWHVEGASNVTLFEGVGNGWLAGIDPFVGEKYLAVPVTSADKISDGGYATGVTGELSFAHNWMVATTEEGVKAWKAIPFNLKAMELTSGLAEGENIKKGQQYNGTFTVKNEHFWLDAAVIPIGVYMNGSLLTLKDANGNEPMKGNYLGEECYFVNLKAQEEKTLSYNWTAPDGEVKLVGTINENPAARKYPETTYEDNVIKKQLAPAEYDIGVQVSPLKNNWVIDESSTTVKTNILCGRKDDTSGAVPIKLTVQGPNGNKVETFTLEPGDKTQYPYNFNAGPGTYTITAEAWPSDDSWEDSYPPDNKDSVTITVKRMDLPETDSNIRVGL